MLHKNKRTNHQTLGLCLTERDTDYANQKKAINC